MQIQPSLHTTKSERQVQMKAGDVVSALIKEQKGSNEAIITVRGREMVASFEGGVPAGERATIQVLSSDSEPMQVRAVQEQTKREAARSKSAEGRSQEVSQVLRQLGVAQPSTELREAARMLLDKNVPLSRESVRDLQRFVNEGNSAKRLQTVQAVANKSLDVTSSHLRAVHEAMHGRPMNEVLTSIAKEIDQDYKVEPISRERREFTPRLSQESDQASQGQKREPHDRRVNQHQDQGLSQSQKTTPEVRFSRESASDIRNVIQRESLQRGSDRLQQVMSISQQDKETMKNAENILREVRSTDRAMNDRIQQVLVQLENHSTNSSDRQAIREVRQLLEQQGLSQVVKERIEQMSNVTGRGLTNVHEQLSSEMRQADQVQTVARDRLLTAFNQLESNVTKRLVERDNQVRQVDRSEPGQRLHQGADLGNREPTIREQLSRLQSDSQREMFHRVADRVQELANQPQVDRETSRSVQRLLAESRHLVTISTERVNQALQQMEKSTSGSNATDRQLVTDVRQQIQQEGLSNSARQKIDNVIQQLSIAHSSDRDNLSVATRQANQLQLVATERMQQSLNLLEQRAQVPEMGKESSPIQELTKPISKITKEAETILRKEASLEQALQKIQSLVGADRLPERETSLINQSLDTAKELHQQGRELKARQELASTFQEINQQNQPARVAETNTYRINEEFQTSVAVESKSIAVTTVTEKMAQMTFDFKKLQRDLTRNLNLVNRQMDQVRHQAQTQAKPVLEATIKNLDNAILKSEMMLFTDMKTERQLMQASSQLAEAKKLLGRGQVRQASEIVHDVKQQIEKLQFQPSDTKVKHYTAANEQALRELQSPAQSFGTKYAETIRGPIQEGSPRAMFEMLRNVGLNRDSDIALQLASGREQQDLSERNLKSILMQLARGEEEGSRLQQLANQAVTNVTGQQLLSRSDHQSNLQSLYFQLPFLLENKVENLQVYVNSRNEGDKIDWENCSLYFLMETPKMGEIGIVVSSNERQLSVTLKNDNDDFQEKMKPLIDMAVTKLSEIGYSINGINYSKLNSTQDPSGKQESDTTTQQPIFGEKGFDYKI
ncbi:hypothetical protein N0O92_15820 [Alkalihalobacillus sp. MEB130]|uniref:hypothetical protein n=1 Tax=Alkalihalobacillus sp. MEB130 TaxID=2976704 RepID=UPI0028DFC02C|nr:hypothetical protein [Alkalihalobacillus sp. MEB130]MDT8861686.1 hypothetical protein [Alkalihalobacillus sp. MEB130]